MKKQIINLTSIAFCAIIIFAGCKKTDDLSEKNSKKPLGFLYTTTNGEGTNQVVRFTRNHDGSLSNETAYTTNSKGGAICTGT